MDNQKLHTPAEIADLGYEKTESDRLLRRNVNLWYATTFAPELAKRNSTFAEEFIVKEWIHMYKQNIKRGSGAWMENYDIFKGQYPQIRLRISSLLSDYKHVATSLNNIEYYDEDQISHISDNVDDRIACARFTIAVLDEPGYENTASHSLATALFLANVADINHLVESHKNRIAEIFDWTCSNKNTILTSFNTWMDDQDLRYPV